MKKPMQDKSPALRAIIEDMFPGTAKAIDEKRCPMCGVVILMGNFRDPISAREYEISGMCQGCQDQIFGE
jgi:hypothetical protein